MKVRFFGSSGCQECIYSTVIISKANLDCTYVDALNEDKAIQDLCDKYDVDDLPHLQFLNDDNKVVIEHIGILRENDLMNYLTNYFPENIKVVEER